MAGPSFGAIVYNGKYTESSVSWCKQDAPDLQPDAFMTILHRSASCPCPIFGGHREGAYAYDIRPAVKLWRLLAGRMIWMVMYSTEPEGLSVDGALHDGSGTVEGHVDVRTDVVLAEQFAETIVLKHIVHVGSHT